MVVVEGTPSDPTGFRLAFARIDTVVSSPCSRSAARGQSLLPQRKFGRAHRAISPSNPTAVSPSCRKSPAECLAFPRAYRSRSPAPELLRHASEYDMVHAAIAMVRKLRAFLGCFTERYVIARHALLLGRSVSDNGGTVQVVPPAREGAPRVLAATRNRQALRHSRFCMTSRVIRPTTLSSRALATEAASSRALTGGCPGDRRAGAGDQISLWGFDNDD
jgi:hypothetical protein